MESISVSSSALPFAGRREGGGLGRLRWERGKSPVSRKTRMLVTTGCSSSFGGGEPLPPRHAASHARRGKVLRLQAARPTQQTVTVSTRCRRNRQRGRSDARKHRFEERWPLAFNLRACLQRTKASVSEADVARCPLTSKEVSSRVPQRSKGRGGKRGRTRRVTGFKRADHSRRARIGRSRGVPVRLVVNVAEVAKRRRTQRSARSPLHPIWESCGTGV